jgi:DNA-directed RNA polymerase specialized sigma24 family protein
MEAAELERVVVTGHEALWVRLVGTGIRMGLSFQDAEDVAQESILAAMAAFDPARGDFGGLAYTACRNRARNALSRRRPTVPVEESTGADTPVDRSDPLGDLLDSRHGREIERLSAAVLALLDDEEARLFYEVGRVLEERDSRAVSEAARHMGLSAQRGWDLFRRIQRKARAANLSIPDIDEERAEQPRAAMARPPAPAAAPAMLGRVHEDRLFDGDHGDSDFSEGCTECARLMARDEPPAETVSAAAIRRPWAGFRRFLERIGADARHRLTELPP